MHPVASVNYKGITTLEGLGNTRQPHPLQKAFIEEQAAQCAYCINGIIMTAKVLQDNTPNPTTRTHISEVSIIAPTQTRSIACSSPSCVQRIWRRLPASLSIFPERATNLSLS